MRYILPAMAVALTAALGADSLDAQQRHAPALAQSPPEYVEYGRSARGAAAKVSYTHSQAADAALCAPVACAPCASECAICCETDCCGTCGEEDACDCECECEEEDACGCEEEEAEVVRLIGDVSLPFLSRNQCGCEDPPTMFIGGWVQGGITGNADGNRSATGNFPVPFNQVSDGFIFNQAPWIFAEKLPDTEANTVDWGFRVDYVFGTDGPDTQAFGDRGWDFGWNSSRDYGSAIPQLYGEIAVNDVSVKVGHFFTIIGYEVVPATGNFFYSHALTMNYGEPFTHTGALGKYAPDDTWTFYGGYTFGWDSGFENNADAHTVLGGVSYAWEDIGTLTWCVNAGDFGDGGPLPEGGVAAAGDIYMHSLVASLNLAEDLVYVFQHDYAANTNIPGGADAYWYGINQYLFYPLTDTVKLGGRFEWFDDVDGARIGAANPAGAGAAGDYYEATVGLNWTPHTNLTIRPEARWDWFDGDAPAGALPYDSGTDDNLFTFGVDGIVQF